MTRNLKFWAFGLIWLLIVGGLAASYMAGQIVAGTLVFFEALAVVLGVTAVVFWKKTTGPSESVTDLLYEAEQPASIGAPRHDDAQQAKGPR